jgi:hypothetical protein
MKTDRKKMKIILELKFYLMLVAMDPYPKYKMEIKYFHTQLPI